MFCSVKTSPCGDVDYDWTATIDRPIIADRDFDIAFTSDALCFYETGDQSILFGDSN